MTDTTASRETAELNPVRRVPRRVAIGVVVAAIAVLTLWLLGTPSGVGGKMLAIGYAICHQILQRSFLIDGSPMPLCARCTGIYLGVTIGFLLAHIAGRGRAAALPRGWVAFFYGLSVLIMGIDGVNSYIHLFPGGTGAYQPHNVLRVVTGIFAGFGVFNSVYPVFNAVVWQEAQEGTPTIRNLRELIGAYAILIVTVLLVLSDRPLFLTILAFMSVVGVVLMLVMIGTVLFVTVFRLEGTFTNVRSLAIPLLAGVTITFIEIGGINAIRLFLTGTWGGLPLGG
jgi:uncharacterized membrane protein